MKKFVLVVPAFSFLAFSAISQTSDKNADTAREYIPVEVHSKTDVRADLQGTWILSSGVQPVKRPEVAKEFETKKQMEGTEKRVDSVTRTEKVNGVTQTTTEVKIEKVAAPESNFTPPQGQKMHQPDRPTISFYGSNETFSGYTGCNKYSGRFSLHGNKINLSSANPSTKMACIGEYDEKDFLSKLRQVNSFRSVNGTLELLKDDTVLLTFSRK
jgi:heat shock protein HslJ